MAAPPSDLAVGLAEGRAAAGRLMTASPPEGLRMAVTPEGCALPRASDACRSGGP
ncbi:hypothetical protein ACP70R_047233 [Stipagrostis hirtigluma subsp. patula]